MPTKISLSEMSTVNVSQLIKILTNAYTKFNESGLSFKEFPSVMLWGQPGVGKSQAVKEIGEELEENTGKKVKITDVRLLLFNPIDLRGIPVANAEHTLAVWLKPQIFQMSDSPDVINILMLDEISAAPQSVQSAAYQITLDRKVGEHQLPNNCIVICAGNRVTDKSVAYKMPKALANRLLHFDVETSFASWKAWAIHKGINPMIMGFLNEHQDLLNTFNSSDDKLAFATPRSWEMVSNILNYVSSDIDEVYPLITGLVGSGIAVELRTWNKFYNKIPKVTDIAKGKMVDVPSEISLVFALSCSIINYLKETLNVKEIANIINYLNRLPKDFSVLVIKEMLTFDDDHKSLYFSIPEFGTLLASASTTSNGR